MTNELRIVVFIIIGYIVLVNIITTYRLFKCENYEQFQKIVQYFLIWLIPLLGAVIVASVLNSEPVKLSKNASRYSLLLKWLFLPLFISIESNLDKNIGNSDAGYFCPGD